MRSRQIEIAAYGAVAVLLALAVAVAALRSRPPAVPEPAAAPGSPGAEAGPVAEPERGAEIFAAECASCHPAGREVASGEPWSAPGGREALLDLLLAGSLAGEEGAHPDFASLPDADLAALARYLIAGQPPAEPAGAPEITAAEVAARRPEPLD